MKRISFLSLAFLLLSGSLMAKETKWPELRNKKDAKAKATSKATKNPFDGKKISIKGFLLPLDFEAKKISEFLLLPYVPSCMHVPPPPADQVIFVKMKNTTKIEPTYYPVLVEGTLKSASASFEMLESGWEMTGESVKEVK